jgi:hypothetical protein
MRDLTVLLGVTRLTITYAAGSDEETPRGPATLSSRYTLQDVRNPVDGATTAPRRIQPGRRTLQGA